MAGGVPGPPPASPPSDFRPLAPPGLPPSNHVDLTATHDEEEDKDTYLGSIIAQFYGKEMCPKGWETIEVGCQVHLVKDPQPTHPWAIRVDNMQGEPVGVLEKASALAISAVLNQDLVEIFAKVNDTNAKQNKFYELKLHFYGYPSRLQALLSLLRSIPYSNFDVAARASSSQNTREELGIDIKSVEDDMDKLFNTLTDLSKLPEKEPHQCIIPTLHGYQKQGLYYMTEREKRLRMSKDEKTFFQWFQKEKGSRRLWCNKLTKKEQLFPPEMARGGILADEMGLGKTLQIICLVAATCQKVFREQEQLRVHQSESNRQKNWQRATMQDEEEEELIEAEEEEVEEEEEEEEEAEEQREIGEEKLQGTAGLGRAARVAPTLIVCPLSVISNWQQQFDRHVTPGYMNCYLYHGPQRVKEPNFLRRYDVIITTYDILKREYKPEPGEKTDKTEGTAASVTPANTEEQGYGGEMGDEQESPQQLEQEEDQPSPLFKIQWQRVVLDEAHIIRDWKTQQSRAACSLPAERRWAITGTPIQNRIGDLYAILKFLQLEPFSDLTNWRKFIEDRIKSKDPQGLDRLRKLLGLICLRRRKNQEIDGKAILQLPTKDARIKYVYLQGKEKLLYDQLELSADKELQHLIDQGDGGTDKVMKNYAWVLEILLRMRQACDHLDLVPAKYHRMGFGQKGEEKMDEIARLITQLEEEAHPCARCQAALPTEPIITACTHVYCRSCIHGLLATAGGSGVVCSASWCGESISDRELYDRKHPIALAIKQRDDLQEHHDRGGWERSSVSSKLEALLAELSSSEKSDSTYKAVVFTQWTAMLDIVASALRAQNIPLVRLDGQMTSKARQQSINSFQEDPCVKVFLISLKAGGVGLNLTAANIVLLLDPWWNPAAEDQAVDRIHRLGQTRKVDVVRLICKDTIEERLMAVQQRKRDMTTMALGGLGRSRKQEKEDRLQDILALLGASKGKIKLLGNRNR
eukprot:gb/GEZN01001354.1/.p1 GENE.gb/GEZN01001354.1/~~gb/GEZN01001354.1/.p1  ORF type:complete len:1020 (-),score=259.69 gb/GEZN01001354.1/:53-2983(-)